MIRIPRQSPRKCSRQLKEPSVLGSLQRIDFPIDRDLKTVLPDDKLPQPQEMLNSRYKSRPLASHGTPWRYSKTAHRCDTRRHGRIAPIRRAPGCPPAARDWTTSEIEKH